MANRRTIVVLLFAVVVLGCGPGEPADVRVGSGVQAGSDWVAFVHRFQNGLLRDDRVCVEVRFDDRGPVDSSCGWNVPPEPGMEIEGSGFIMAMTWNETATQARYEPAGSPAVVLPVMPGDPISHARWVVLSPEVAPAAAWPPPFRIVFQDADGHDVDSIRN
jgi:hypothetical protein